MNAPIVAFNEVELRREILLNVMRQQPAHVMSTIILETEVAVRYIIDGARSASDYKTTPPATHLAEQQQADTMLRQAAAGVFG